jgi:serine/threonine protein kinase
MGEVWLAVREGPVSSYVALKAMHDAGDAPEAARSAMLDEARLIARIRSPNVAQMLEVFEAEGSLCLAMEWVDGIPLSQLTNEQKPLPLGMCLRVVADACAGLHAAHELCDDAGGPLNIVHRDVSPQNIMVDRNGTTKLIDFGIARAEGRLSAVTGSIIKGKAAYMSREQAGHGTVDRRSDIFSLGVVLYEMLTGTRPFPGDDDLSRLIALAKREPLRSMPPEVPSPVRGILTLALAHDPAARFATARELRSELEATLSALNMPTDSADVANALSGKFTEHAEPVSTLVELEHDGSGDATNVLVSIPVPRIAQPAQPLRQVPDAAGPTQRASRPTRALPVALLSAAFALSVTVVWGASRGDAPLHLGAHDRTKRAADSEPALSPSALATELPSGSASHTVAQELSARPLKHSPGGAHESSSARANASPSNHASKPAKCDPPWFVDANGHRVYRTECL